ncbi:MAG: GNAT family N-acetyltransferase [Planctomycetota bacterium]|jgi:putative acetyltransferase
MPHSDLHLRPEDPADIEAIHDLHVAAFESPAEADLVDALRDRAQPYLSLVAECAGKLVGHILFTPVTLEDHADLNLMGLAPMAVLPGHQSSGIGSALVEAGLASCRTLGIDAVAVLGHPKYYPRFGFVPSVQYGIDSEYEVPAEVFLIHELKQGRLAGRAGRIRYHQAFSGL